MGGNRAQQFFLGFLVRRPFQLPFQVKVIPADDAVFDQPVAAFGDFLLFLFGLGVFVGVANSHRTGELIGQFHLVELLFNGLAEFGFIDIAEDEQ